MSEDYQRFIEGKIRLAAPAGFAVDPAEAIAQYTMPGETVLDPFAGIGTVPYCAIKQGRRGLGVELNADYFRDATRYCEAAEAEASVPTLFDLLDVPAEAAE